MQPKVINFVRMTDTHNHAKTNAHAQAAVALSIFLMRGKKSYKPVHEQGLYLVVPSVCLTPSRAIHCGMDAVKTHTHAHSFIVVVRIHYFV